MIGVCIVTYNEDLYIAQCIESALFQVCSEEYRIYIGEDNSTDKTLSICNRYAQDNPDKIKLIARAKNLGLVRNTIDLLRTMQSDGCEYIAMLDGDDYWIDKYKLQKEFDFLNKNQDYGLVHTQMHLLINDKLIRNHRKNVVQGNTFLYTGKPNAAIGNCTCMFRTELLNYCNLDDFITNQFMSVDYVMYAIFAKYTKFGFLDDFTAVWRRGHSSVSNTNNVEKQIAYLQNDDRMWKYLGQLFPEQFYYDKESALQYYNSRCFQIAFKSRDFKRAYQAISDGFKCNSWKMYFKRILVTILYRLKYSFFL